MARRPQGSVRKSPPRLKQGKPKPPGVGRPSPRPKRSKGPVGGPRPKSRINPQQKALPEKFERFGGKLDRNPTVQGRARGGMLKGIIRIPPLPTPQPMPKSGVISTIDKGIRKPRPAEKFVKIRERVNKLGGYAMGGEAREGAARGELQKKRKTQRQQELMDMLERLYGGKGKPQPGPTIRRKPKKTDEKKFMDRPILPRDKPKGKPIRPILPRDFKKPKMKRAK